MASPCICLPLLPSECPQPALGQGTFPSFHLLPQGMEQVLLLPGGLGATQGFNLTEVRLQLDRGTLILRAVQF